MHFVFLLLISVIPIMLLNFLSAMIPFLFVLKLLLPPFQVGCLASLYVDQFQEVEEKTGPRHGGKTTDAAPLAFPVTEGTGDQVEEESKQSEQPASKETKTSDQETTESLPEENVLDEKQGQEADVLLDQAEEKSGPDSEKDPKDTL